MGINPLHAAMGFVGGNGFHEFGLMSSVWIERFRAIAAIFRSAVARGSPLSSRKEV